MKVKGIVNKKVKHSQTLYKVKFKGDRPDEWKKADELDAELIQLFEDKRKAHREKKRARESGTQVAEEAAPPAKAARSVCLDVETMSGSEAEGGRGGIVDAGGAVGGGAAVDARRGRHRCSGCVWLWLCFFCSEVLVLREEVLAAAVAL